MATIKLTAFIACFHSLAASAQDNAVGQIIEPQTDSPKENTPARRINFYVVNKA